MLFGFLPAGPDPHSFCGDHRASGLHSWASLGRGDCIVHLHRVSSRRGLRGDVRDCPLAASRYAHSRYNNSQLAVSPSEGSSPIEPSPSLSLPCWAPGRLPWPPESQIHTCLSGGLVDYDPPDTEFSFCIASATATRKVQVAAAVWGHFADKSNGIKTCLLYTSPSPRDGLLSRMPSSA